MRLLLLLTLLLAAVAATAAVAGSVSLEAPGIPKTFKQCLIERRKIMEAARRYYKAQFEAKLLLVKLRYHRQIQTEKRLRYQKHLTRMRLAHKARIQKRIAHFRHQVTTAKKTFTKKLKSLTKRYQRKVIKKLKDKTVSRHRMKLIKKAFFQNVPVIRLRPRLSILELEKQQKRIQNRMTRKLERTLVLRRRIYLKAHTRRVLGRRNKVLTARRRDLNQRIRRMAKRQREQLHKLRLLLGQNQRPHDGLTRRLAIHVKSSTRLIRQLNIRQLSLKRRIGRIAARRQRLLRDISLLRRRLVRQLNESNTVSAQMNRLWSRTGAKIPPEYTQFSAVFGRGKIRRRHTPTIITRSRLAIKHIIGDIKRINKGIRENSIKALKSRRLLRGFKEKFIKLQNQKKVLELEARRSRGATYKRILRQISKIKSELTLLKLNREAENRNLKRTTKAVHEKIRAYQKAIIKYDLRDFIGTGSHGVRVELITRSTPGAQSRKNLIGIRIIRRVRRIQRQIKHEAKKILIIYRHKLHIQKRKALLRQRVQRIIERGRRIRQRIVAIRRERMRQIKRLVRLKISEKRVRPVGVNWSVKLGLIRKNISTANKRIAQSTSHVNTLKRRLERIQKRIKQTRELKRRYRHRLNVIRKRIRRHAKRLQHAIARKSRFVKRVVRQKLISRQTITRIIKPTRHILRIIPAKLSVNRKKRRQLWSKRTKKQLAHLKLPMIKPIRLSPKKSVSSIKVKLVAMHDQLARHIKRTLIIRRRIHKKILKRRVLRRKVNLLKAKKHILKRQVATATSHHNSLIRKLKSLPTNTKLNHPVKVLLKHRITTSSKRIHKLTQKHTNIRRRIVKITNRRKQILKKISSLRKRERRQLDGGKRFYKDIARVLGRSKTYGTKQFKKTLSVIKKKVNRKQLAQKPVLTKIKTRNRFVIKHIVSKLQRMHAKLIKYNVKAIRSRRRLHKHKLSIEKLTPKQKALTHKARRTAGKSQIRLLHRIRQVKSKLAASNRNFTAERHKLSRFRKQLLHTASAYHKKLTELGLKSFTHVRRYAISESTKIQRRLGRRQQRRRKRIAEQRKLLKKITHTPGVSARTVRRTLKLYARKVRRSQRKRIARRIVRRVKRIQKQLKHEARMVKVIQHRKLKIKQRRVHLKQKAQKIAKRKVHIAKKIATTTFKRNRLVTKLTKLNNLKAQIALQPQSKTSFSKVQHIDSQITKTTHKVKQYTVRINKLKRRHFKDHIRLQRIVKKRRRLHRRLKAIKRRAQRHVKNLRRVVAKKRRFVKRVVKKRLITRRKIKRIALPTKRTVYSVLPRYQAFRNDIAAGFSPVKIRREKSVGAIAHRLRKLHLRLSNGLKRVLTLRRRILKKLNKRLVLRLRIGQFSRQRNTLLHRIHRIRVRCGHYIKALELSNDISNRSLKVKDFSLFRVRDCTSTVQRLKRRERRVKRRIARNHARRKILSHEISKLQKQERRQIKYGSKFFGRIARTLVKRVPSDRKIIYGFLKTVRHPVRQINVTKDTVKRFAIDVYPLQERIVHWQVSSIASQRRLSKLRQRIKQLTHKKNLFLKKVHHTKNTQLRHEIKKLNSELRHLKIKTFKEHPRLLGFQKAHQRSMLKLRKAIIKYKLNDFIRSSQQVQQQIQRSLRQIRIRKERRRQRIAKQRRWLQKISRTPWISRRTVNRMINAQKRRFIRSQRSEAVKRAIRYIRQVQEQVKYEARKTSIIRRRKLHVKRRQIRLRRRAQRISERRRRLARRVLTAEMKSISLTTKMRQLTRRVQRLRQTGRASAIRVYKYNCQIKRGAQKVAQWTTRVSKLRKRQAHILLRLKTVAKEQIKMRRRLSGLRRRYRRQKNRLHRAIVRKRKLLKRVVKLRLISRRKIRLLFKPTRYILKVYNPPLRQKVFSVPGKSYFLPEAVGKFRKRFHIKPKQVKLLKRIKKQISSEILQVTKNLDTGVLIRQLVPPLPHLAIRKSIQKVFGVRLMKTSAEEEAAKRVLQSERDISVRKLEDVEQNLERKLSLLKKKVAKVQPAFKNLVKKAKEKFLNVERNVSRDLATSVSNIKRTLKQILKKQDWLYKKQYQVYILESKAGVKDDSGVSEREKEDGSESWSRSYETEVINEEPIARAY